MTAVWIRAVYTYRYHRICTAKYTKIHKSENLQNAQEGLEGERGRL